MPIGTPGGGEINFAIGNATQGMGAQSIGPMNSPVMQDANQFSVPFNHGKSPLTTSLQETCGKINEVAHFEANMNKAISAGENLNAIKLEVKTVGGGTSGIGIGGQSIGY